MTVLTYDDLPPGSDIRREISAERIQITVPAGESPRAVLKQAALDGLSAGAIAATPLLLLALGTFIWGLRANRLSGTPTLWAWGFFMIFSAAIVAMVAWLRIGMLSDGIRAGRMQATVIAATPMRLVIETAGPFGTASYDYSRDQLMSIVVGGGMITDEHKRLHPLRWLEVRLRDGRAFRLLPGRDARELLWVRGSIVQMMNLQAA